MGFLQPYVFEVMGLFQFYPYLPGEICQWQNIFNFEFQIIFLALEEAIREAQILK